MSDELQLSPEEISAWRAQQARKGAGGFNPFSGLGAGIKRMWKTSPKAMSLLGVLMFIGGMIFGGLREGGHFKLIAFAQDSANFGLQAIVIVLFSLGVVYLSQLIRTWKWFDRRGSAREMKTIQDRAGTENEKSGDPIALAIQYSGTTLLIATVLLAYFLIHDPS